VGFPRPAERVLRLDHDIALAGALVRK
jgi:hypothetical protein